MEGKSVDVGGRRISKKNIREKKMEMREDGYGIQNRLDPFKMSFMS